MSHLSHSEVCRSPLSAPFGGWVLTIHPECRESWVPVGRGSKRGRVQSPPFSGEPDVFCRSPESPSWSPRSPAQFGVTQCWPLPCPCLTPPLSNKPRIPNPCLGSTSWGPQPVTVSVSRTHCHHRKRTLRFKGLCESLCGRRSAVAWMDSGPRPPPFR